MKDRNEYSPRYFPMYGKLRYIPAGVYILTSGYDYEGTEDDSSGQYWDIVRSPSGEFLYTDFYEIYLSGEGYEDAEN